MRCWSLASERERLIEIIFRRGTGEQPFSHLICYCFVDYTKQKSEKIFTKKEREESSSYPICGWFKGVLQDQEPTGLLNANYGNI